MKVHLFPVYGLLGGRPFGASLGVDAIADRACQAHPRLVRHRTMGWYQEWSATREIDALPDGDLALFIPHSNGVHLATKIAELRPERLFAIIGIDGTVVPPEVPHPLGANVIRALSIIGVDNGSLVGHAALECAEGVSVPIERVETNTVHVKIDDDPEIQAVCLRFIADVLKEVA